MDTEIEALTLELLRELFKMSIEELEQFRPGMTEKMAEAGHLHPLAERYLNAAFDQVIERKRKNTEI
ncbi:hypothetical protein [Lacrimispora sp. 210928-DFI.3.58]|uniref:hypothetical protein n=1 Tax=Lacrimispora sp. 210928-DFI.3.58 TaxID=2883214 RepID=UPI001D086090|nr:hypothetical protein [Lacrimispora sp. 210928-DFI.3.58]MCB7317156.1 hypothetical protein [Lacrimispora sp. 210928-DFI.3.58]